MPGLRKQVLGSILGIGGFFCLHTSTLAQYFLFLFRRHSTKKSGLSLSIFLSNLLSIIQILLSVLSLLPLES